MKHLLLMLPFLGMSLSCNKNAADTLGGGILPGGGVSISEVKQYTSLTIRNGTNEAVNLAGCKLVEIRDIIFADDDTNIYVIPSGVIAKGSSISYSAGVLGFWLGADETVYLYNNAGKLISQLYWMFFS